MIIDNDTDDPVDYDVDIDVGGGGGGMNMDGGSGNGGNMTVDAAEESVSAGRPRFFLDRRSNMEFDLSTTGYARHKFLINLGTEEQTYIELRHVPTTVARVALTSAESGGETFYRIVTS